MGRRIFDERNYVVYGNVLPYDQFKPFCDLDNGFTVAPERIPEVIKLAEEMLETEIPQLLASQYMMFNRCGDRFTYERKYDKRREMLLYLSMGEYLERKGRFTDKLIDVIWLILEESTWIVPAHNYAPAELKTNLPWDYNSDVTHIALMSAGTGASMAWVYYLCKDILDEVTPTIARRMRYEIDRQVIKPFLNDRYMFDRCWWAGAKGSQINNWNPWIVSNVLTATALTEEDTITRTVVVSRALTLLDRFINIYHPDGGCDEGVAYWAAAGGALYSALIVLYDMTGGYVNIFDDPLIKNMGEYPIKMLATEDLVLNFSDCRPNSLPMPMLLYHWGKACGSEMMQEYAKWKMHGSMPIIKDYRQCYRLARFLTTPRLSTGEFAVPKHTLLHGLEIGVIREEATLDKGLYVALKGGHNKESHNHNDVGSVIVYADGKPVFIDPGTCTYTNRTFTNERYNFWPMCSDFHNCATFNGVTQQPGQQACSGEMVFDAEKNIMSLDLVNAYPTEANLSAYTRTVELNDSVITITDDVAFHTPGTVMFSYITRSEPKLLNETTFTVEGKTVGFDSNLAYAVSAVDKSEPETKTVPGDWGVEDLYRITLTTKQLVESGKFILTVQ